jgi:hypothetical protein
MDKSYDKVLKTDCWRHTCNILGQLDVGNLTISGIALFVVISKDCEATIRSGMRLRLLLSLRLIE